MAFGCSHWNGRPAAARSLWAPDVLGRRCTTRRRMCISSPRGEDQGEGEFFSPQALISRSHRPRDRRPAQAMPSRGPLKLPTKFPERTWPSPAASGVGPIFNRDVHRHIMQPSFYHGWSSPHSRCCRYFRSFRKKLQKRHFARFSGYYSCKSGKSCLTCPRTGSSVVLFRFDVLGEPQAIRLELPPAARFSRAAVVWRPGTPCVSCRLSSRVAARRRVALRPGSTLPPAGAPAARADDDLEMDREKAQHGRVDARIQSPGARGKQGIVNSYDLYLDSQPMSNTPPPSRTRQLTPEMSRLQSSCPECRIAGVVTASRV
jgi:hypothetical protein